MVNKEERLKILINEIKENIIVDFDCRESMSTDNISIRNSWNELLHILDLRKCFVCSAPIRFDHFFNKCRKEGIGFLDAINIWRSKYVEIFCCECYSRILFKNVIRDYLQDYLQD